MEDLVQTIYHSQTTTDADTTEHGLERLLHEARARNTRLGVTGALLCGHGRFAQVLEGRRSAVMEVMRSISLDPRHRKLSVVRKEKPIEQASFANWAMAGLYCGDGISKITPILDLDAQSLGLSGDCLLAMLKWFVEGDEAAVCALPEIGRATLIQIGQPSRLLH